MRLYPEPKVDGSPRKALDAYVDPRYITPTVPLGLGVEYFVWACKRYKRAQGRKVFREPAIARRRRQVVLARGMLKAGALQHVLYRQRDGGGWGQYRADMVAFAVAAEVFDDPRAFAEGRVREVSQTMHRLWDGAEGWIDEFSVCQLNHLAQYMRFYAGTGTMRWGHVQESCFGWRQRAFMRRRARARNKEARAIVRLAKWECWARRHTPARMWRK